MEITCKENIPKFEYYHQVLKKTIEKCIPVYAIYEVTYGCNLNCVHCYIVNRETSNDLNTEQSKKVIDILANAGVLYLTFTGGEIFTRKDILELSRYAINKNFAIRLMTNGILINEKIADEIAEIHPLAVDISFYSTKKDVYESITKVPGSFDRVMNAFKLLKERNVNVLLKCPLMSINVDDFDSVREFAQKWGVSLTHDVSIVPMDDGSLSPLEYQISDDKMADILRWGKEYIQPNEWKSEDNICNTGKNVIAINPVGDVYPCLQFRIKLGNILNDSFEKIWNSEEINKIRNIKFSDLKECQECTDSPFCLFCPGLSFIEKKNFTSPVDEVCTKARITKRVYEEL